jgi:hypothetical protein
LRRGRLIGIQLPDFDLGALNYCAGRVGDPAAHAGVMDRFLGKQECGGAE